MARVALLILTTGLFAALWSGDESEQMASVDRPAKRVVVRRDVPRLTVTSDSSAGLVAAPLPSKIVEGTYLISDQWGRTQIRVISVRDGGLANRAGDSLVGNHYLVERGAQRWHYIRIERPTRDLTTRTRTDSYR